MDSNDLTSFIILATTQNWLAGLKTFLWSPSAQFTFSTLDSQSQKDLLLSQLRAIDSIQDAVLKRSYSAAIIEETLTKKPYVKTLT